MSSVTWNDPPTGQTITTLKLTMAAVCESHVPKECCETVPMGNVKASKWRLVQKRKRLLRAHHLTFIIVLKAFGANIQGERGAFLGFSRRSFSFYAHFVNKEMLSKFMAGNFVICMFVPTANYL